MKNINCRHCSNLCKQHGKTECSKYNAIADRPLKLPILIREAINKGDHKKVKELQTELDQFNYGSMLK
jgi:hypothetical protein